MSTYAVGDIQGCHRTFMRLLERIGFDPGADRLWLVGDLVNRGPSSLEVLRWAAAQPDASLVAVLGNHDVHLLARALAGAPKKARDTIAPILDAPDRGNLIEWLRHRPLLHVEPAPDAPEAPGQSNANSHMPRASRVLVHAGLHPRWDIATAALLAREAESVLRAGADPAARLLSSRAHTDPPDWSGKLRGNDAIASILAILTRLRTCTPDGDPDWDYTGAPDGARKGRVAWFEVRGRRSRDAAVIFGHWASLGLHVAPIAKDAQSNPGRGTEPAAVTPGAIGASSAVPPLRPLPPGVYGIDTGCVYGRVLTALDISVGTIVQEPCVDVS